MITDYNPLSFHNVLSIITDNAIWLILLIPLYIIYQIYRILRIVNFLYKNNRSGYGNGQSKHFADRLVEIYSENKKDKKIKYNQSKYQNINGVAFYTVFTLCKQADDALLEKDLIKKDNNDYLYPNYKNVYQKFGNLVIFYIFKFISQKIYLDNPNFFE
jgi:hypothetical protein